MTDVITELEGRIAAAVEPILEQGAVDLVNEFVSKIPIVGALAEPMIDKLLIGLIQSAMGRLSPNAPATVTVDPKPVLPAPPVTMEPVPNPDPLA